jgi:predicted nucleotidyltransferase
MSRGAVADGDKRPENGRRRSGSIGPHREVAMTTTLTDNPVLARFRKSLHEMYGNRLDRVVLFGSRARGDARPESDYDVAVFLRGMTDRVAELYRLADLSTDIIGETGEFVHAMPYRSEAYDERTPLMREIRREGVEL